MKKHTLYIMFNLFFLVFSLRNLVLTHTMCVGRHWDWNIPCAVDRGGTYTSYDRYVWIPTNLGEAGGLNSTQMVTKFLINNLINLDGQLVGILILFAILTSLSFLFMAKLTERRSGWLIGMSAATLYTYSPYIFNEIVGGGVFLWFGYYLMPLFIFESIAFLNSKTRRFLHLTLLLIIQMFITSTIHFAFFSNAAFVCIVVYKTFIAKNTNYLKRLALYFTGYLLINTYWILPFVHFITDFTATNFPKAEFTTGNLESLKQNILTVPSLFGYLDRNIYFYALNKIQVVFLSLAVLGFWFSVINTQKRRCSKIITILLLLFITSLIVIKGGNKPYTEFTEAVFINFTLMKLFRSPQHLMFIASILVPFILALNQRKLAVRWHIIIVPIIVLGWTSGWWVNGDLGIRNLQKQQRDSIDSYRLEKKFSDLLGEYRNVNKPDRVLFLPADMSPYYIKNMYQNRAQGSEGEYYTLGKITTFWSESNTFLYPIDEYFCKDRRFDLIGFLSLYNVKEVVLRKDLTPAHTVCTPFNTQKWDPEIAQNILDNDASLTKIETGEFFIRYKIDANMTNSRFYVPKSIVKLKKYEELLTLDKIYNNTAYITGDEANIEVTKDYEVTSIVYQNPTEYDLTLSFNSNGHPSTTIPLIFLENYHRDWIVAKAPENTRHMLVNEYANLWLIDGAQYCKQNATDCTNGKIKLKVIFKPQALAKTGGSITLFVAGFIISVALLELIIQTRKDRKLDT